MSGQIGQPKRLKDEAKSKFTEFFDLKPGENYLRIIYGPLKRSQIWWPTQIVEDGETKPRKKFIVRPPEGCILDDICSIEKKIRFNLGEQSPGSSLRPTTKYYYLVIDETKDDPVVEIARFPYKVSEQLMEKEEQIDPDDPTKLRYGLVFMFKWIITKKIDPNKSLQYGTSYSVDPDPKASSEFLGKVPASSLGMEPEELMKQWGKNIEDLFTEAQWEAVQDSKIDLESVLIPNSQAEINAKLVEFPIDINAKDGDNYVFPDRANFIKELQKLEVPMLTEGGELKTVEKETQVEEKETPEDSTQTEEKDPTPPREIDEPAESETNKVETEDAKFEEVESKKKKSTSNKKKDVVW